MLSCEPLPHSVPFGALGSISKFVVILSTTRRGLCGHRTSFRGHTSFEGRTIGDCWLEAISVQARAGIDLKICRSDYETGRWEALKLKPAQMESDACSANRHQPTAGCVKAFDLWELDWHGNCCLTDAQTATDTQKGCTSLCRSTDKRVLDVLIPIQKCIPAILSHRTVKVASYYLVSEDTKELLRAGKSRAFYLSSSAGRQAG